MIQILGLIIVLLVALYVAQPLLSQNPPPTSTARRDLIEDLLAQRDVLYRDVADLQFDHGAGKVSDAEYSEQREEYIEEAAALLQEIDARAMLGAHQAPLTPVDSELEEEIRRFRRTDRNA